MSFATPFSIVGTTSVGSEIRIPEATTNGANYVGFKAPDSLSADKVWTLPSADGTSGQVLQTNGSGVLSFSSVSQSFVYLGATGSQSNVSSVNLNGYFTSDYNVYKIFVDGMYKSGASDGEWFRLRVNTTGSYTTQTTSYNGALLRIRGNLSPPDAQYDGNNTTYWQYALLSTSSTSKTSLEITIYNPLQSSEYHTMTSHAISFNGAGNQNMSVFGGYWGSTTAITGLNFSCSQDNIYVNNIRIYGVKNS